MSSTSSPYKNNYGKRRYKPRRRYNKKTNYTYKIAQKAARTEIAKHDKVVVEMKSYDITFVNGSTVSYTGLVTPITPPIVKGTNATDRIGNEIHVKGLLFRLQLVPNAQYNNVRIVVIRWNSSGTPAAANIFQTTGSNAAPFSPLIRDASHKFQVLFDNLYTIGVDMANDIQTEKMYLQKVGRAVWDDSSGGQKGQIFLVAISGAIAQMPGLFLSARTRFTDS